MYMVHKTMENTISLSEYVGEAVARGRRSVKNELEKNDSVDEFVRNLLANGYQEIDSRPPETYNGYDIHSGAALWSARHSDTKCFYASRSENLGMDIVYVVVPDFGKYPYHVLQVYFFSPGKKNIYSYWYDRLGRLIKSDGMIRLDELNNFVFGEDVDEFSIDENPMLESVSRGKSGKYVEMSKFDDIKRYLERSNMEYLDSNRFKVIYGTNQNMIIDRNGPCWAIVDWSEIHGWEVRPKTQLVVSDGIDRVGWLWYDDSGNLVRERSEYYAKFYGYNGRYVMTHLLDEKALESTENLLKEVSGK